MRAHDNGDTADRGAADRTAEGRGGGITRRAVLGGAALAGAAGVGVALGRTALAAPSSVAAAAPASRSPFDVGAPFDAAAGTTREYWIQVDSFEHNLVPTGLDAMMNERYAASDSSFVALGYRAFTREWGAPLAANDDIGPNTGIPGPIIRARAGDTVKIHFRNNDTYYRWPHSMHPHGFTYTPENDGGFVAAQDLPGRAVPFGRSYTYTWRAHASSVGTWPYHDHSPAQHIMPPPGSAAASSSGMPGPVMELPAELGLFGLIAITDEHTAPVDRELLLFFHDLYQADVPSLSQDYDCFNGSAYLGNTPAFEARVGDRVRWRIAALGKEFHVFHLHGHRWLDASGRLTDSQILGPSTTLTVEYTEDNPGDWLYHCHVTDHMAGGMVGWYRVGA